MRKNNDGYVIIYVIFVILFLCIVAIGTCSSALSNLQSQNEAVVQMKERYAAEGGVEMLVANMCTSAKNAPVVSSPQTLGEAKQAAQNSITNIFGPDSVTVSGFEEKGINIYYCTGTCGVNVPAVTATVEFQFEITFEHKVTVYKEPNSDTIVEKPEDKDPDIEYDEVHLFSYRITNVTSKYLSYIIKSTGGDAA